MKIDLTLRLNGITYDKKFIFSEIGYNFEPSEIGAAFGLVQLGKLSDNIKKRSKNFTKHYKFFNEFNNFFDTPIQSSRVKTGWLAYPITIKKNPYFTRTELQIYLEKKNIQTRVCFTGNILKQPGFKNIKCLKKKNYPIANNVMKNTLLIACHHGLSSKQVEYIHENIKKFLKQKIKN